MGISKKMATMSELMRKVLGDIADGKSGYEGCYGRSEYGGRNGTLVGLRRRGLITRDDEITDDGLQLLGHEIRATAT